MNGENEKVTHSHLSLKNSAFRRLLITFGKNNPEMIKPRDAFRIAKTLDISIDEIIFLKDESYFKYVLVEEKQTS